MTLQCEEVKCPNDTAHKAPLVTSLISIRQAVPETLESHCWQELVP